MNYCDIPDSTEPTPIFARELMLTIPTMLNLELTTRCPLRCPQCYCDLSRGKDLPLDRALHVLRESAQMGVKTIMLSGGESMVYPHIYELISECKSLGLYSCIALSGYGIDENSLKKMIDCGISEIFVSLNGSTEDVSKHTRDGHHLAINTLKLLSESDFTNYTVNWVAHKSNIHDFENVVQLCISYKVKRLMVMAFKPDSSHSLPSLPDSEQFLLLACMIKRMQKEITELKIEVEPCYSPLCAFLGQKFLLNINMGISKGCGAGLDGASLDVDGNFTPCRHLDFPEKFDSLLDYWYSSKILHHIRQVEDSPEANCDKCKYERHCLSCLAVNVKLNGRTVKANNYCNLWE